MLNKDNKNKSYCCLFIIIYAIEVNWLYLNGNHTILWYATVYLFPELGVQWLHIWWLENGHGGSIYSTETG